MFKRIMNKTALWMALLYICSIGIGPHFTADAANNGSTDSIQQLIQQAMPGDTIMIPPGDYSGSLVIDKPISLKASSGSVRIQNNSDQPAILIQSDHTMLSGIDITDTATKDTAAVVINSNHNTIEYLSVHTNSSGFHLREANQNVIHHTQITWNDSATMTSDKGNGIDLLQSNQNVLSDNTISNVHDGIYLESSDEIRIERNQVDHSRYGIHCMYTQGTSLLNNTGSYNVTGAMVMGAVSSLVEDNTFYKQSDNVNSQGLLLYDVQTSQIRQNRIEDNRVGIYVEESQKNQFTDNLVNQNYVGLQMLTSEQNQWMNNQFFGNVIQSEATESKNNELRGNYWDGFVGIDLDGNGKSDISYAMNPFFQKLTAAIPAYQLFFQSPGMMFLENMLTSESSSWTSDSEPLLHPPFVAQDRSAASAQSTLWLSVFLMGLALFSILYLGVKRK